MICCVTGHRPSGFPFARDPNTLPFFNYSQALQEELISLINQGYTHFITGMAEGADLDFAQTIIFLQDCYETLVIEAAYPYPPHTVKNWTKYQEDKEFVAENCNIKHLFRIIITRDACTSVTNIWLTKQTSYWRFGTESKVEERGTRSSMRNRKTSQSNISC